MRLQCEVCRIMTGCTLFKLSSIEAESQYEALGMQSHANRSRQAAIGLVLSTTLCLMQVVNVVQNFVRARHTRMRCDLLHLIRVSRSLTKFQMTIQKIRLESQSHLLDGLKAWICLVQTRSLDFAILLYTRGRSANTRASVVIENAPLLLRSFLTSFPYLATVRSPVHSPTPPLYFITRFILTRYT